jgi:16S rRNA (uracil1498-N3)-methyltransferase
MKTGEEFLVSCGGVSSLCRLDGFEGDSAVAEIIEENYQSTDLAIKIYLFQGLPKSDKMELIIQKAVELGVHAIIPTEMSRCVVKLDDKKKKSKIQRWQTIAESAAKQSKRSAVPTVYETISYKEALEMAKDLDVLMVPYECENGMEETKKVLSQIKEGSSVGIIIGPEGGFEESEVEKATTIGGESISLGKRILRTETAAITAVGMVMLYSEMNLGGETE